MVNRLEELMRENVADPPPDPLDLTTLVAAGRRRVRARRAVASGGAAALVAGVALTAVLVQPRGPEHSAANHPPKPDAPTVHLSEAVQAVEGRDYVVLSRYTNPEVDSVGVQYVYGVTDDGMVLFGDGYRLALVDPATDRKDWLPETPLASVQRVPVELGADRLVIATVGDGAAGRLVAHVYDRGSRRWSAISWPGLPRVETPRAVMGPDGRLYVSVPVSAPVSGPVSAPASTGAGGTYHLWSVSLSDPSDVRDEGLTVGDVIFTESSMLWTDSTHGPGGLVHVRDLASGAEHAFDPRAGARCILRSFGASDDRVALGEYCGTYDDQVRDDRVQVLTTAGNQVVTIQGSGIDGAVSGVGASGGLLALRSYGTGTAGTYVYDLVTDRFLRLSDAVSRHPLTAPAPDGSLVWDTPANDDRGVTQTVAELLGLG